MYDSDFGSSDIGGDDVEFLDTSDPVEKNSMDLEQSNLDIDNEMEDGLHHATKMSEEEVARIDGMWEQDVVEDIEPYRSINNDVTLETDIIDPYKATRTVDSGDLTSDLRETADLEQLQTYKSFEDQFASEIAAMSFEDLAAEQERLERLGGMCDLDIFAEFDNEYKNKYDPELFNALTDGLSKETLAHLRDGLAKGNPDVYEYFGLSGDADDGNEGECTRSRIR